MSLGRLAGVSEWGYHDAPSPGCVVWMGRLVFDHDVFGDLVVVDGFAGEVFAEAGLFEAAVGCFGCER